MTDRRSVRRAVYGWPLEHPALANKSPAQVADQLQDWGIDAVIGPLPPAAILQPVREANIDVFVSVGMFTGKQHWDRHPDSRPITAAGELLQPDRWYHGVNPTHAGVKAERLAYIQHLLQEHPIDGIWLDAIRWPCHWEVAEPRIEHTSFDGATLALFERDTGIHLGDAREDPVAAANMILSQHLDAWTRWRCGIITRLVGEIAGLVKSAGADKWLGAFTVPWQPGDFDGAIIRVIGQDYAALGQHLDVISPMVYHRMCARPVTWIREVAAHVRKLSGRPVWPIIQAMSEPDHLSNEEFAQALRYALETDDSTAEASASGVIVFTLEAMLRADRLATWKRILSS